MAAAEALLDSPVGVQGIDYDDIFFLAIEPKSDSQCFDTCGRSPSVAEATGTAFSYFTYTATTAKYSNSKLRIVEWSQPVRNYVDTIRVVTF